MTRTEERLADALAAVARGVREETLPPLGGRDTARGGRGTAHRRRARRRWGRWLAPVAAAAGVTLVVVLASTVHLFAPRQQPARVAPPPGGLPRYYVSAESTGIQVRRTATGAMTARISLFAGSPGPAAWAVGLAAGDHGREGDGAIELPAAAIDPEHNLIQTQMAVVLQREIRRIPALLRNVVVLRDVQQLPMPAVARRLGITVPAAKSRLFRARIELRSRVLQFCGSNSYDAPRSSVRSMPAKSTRCPVAAA